MHWSLLLSFAWLYLLLWTLLATAIASVALFALFVAHEFGHVAMLRWRRIPVAGITLSGIHGETSYGYARPQDEAWVAWGGVLAQLAVLVVASILAAVVDFSNPLASLIAAPVLFVLTKFNIFLIVIALLPIGPFDGRKAWTAIPLIRSSLRRRVRVNRAPKLTPEQQRELEARSHVEASELIEKLTKKTDASREDA
ncbi:hypothetical protein BWI17_02860 [Betaproteobacteria bacterium GR16-43]|nr:hypothetical protein BWI17_02860 [Betaproteobacteria bacterium GR16-43]